MCGRYSITELPKDVELATEELEDAVFQPNFNVAPTQYCPVIPQTDAARIHFYRWGLIPHWARDMKIGFRMINARSETLAEKNAFKKPLMRSRCLVLADGFYEWKKEGKNKQPFRIVLKNKKFMHLAGLYDAWRSDAGELIYSFTIITTSPNELMVDIHDRMPVILDTASAHEWLRPQLLQHDALNMLRPFPTELMHAYPVSKAVGNVRNNDPSLIEGIT